MATSIAGDFGTNLVSHWKLNESSGNRADSHGSNTLTANGTGGVGTANGGADFERGDLDYLEITDASQSGLDFSGDCSFSIWVNFESLLNAFANMTLLSKYDFNTPSQAYSIDVYRNGSNDELRFIYSSTGSNNDQRTVTFSGTLSTATWYHILVCFDLATRKIDLYLNGSLVGTSAAGALTSIFNSSAPFRLSGFGVSPVDAPLDGQMKEVSVWSRKLSSSDASGLYNSGTPLPYSVAGSNNYLSLLGVT